MPQLRKIEYAIGAAGLFAQHLHTEGFDHGMIATFGNTFRVEQGFTGTERLIHQSLARVTHSVTNEQTRLYDSIEDVVGQFWHAGGDRGRPWLLTVITDGQDNASSRYRGNPRAIGQYVATHYNHEPTNFIFVIGVGEGNQIDKRALGTLGDAGGFMAMTIEAFPLLEVAFLMIALKVTEQLVGRQINVGNVTWEQVAQIRQVNHVPIDYAFLIDRSGSMSEPG
jgi:hypothetical protein